ncbi:MAG: hypothetical protein AABZ39_16830 [Spirochaetota bacterium]
MHAFTVSSGASYRPRIIAFAAAFVFAASFSASASHVAPLSTGPAAEFEGITRLFVSFGELDVMAEAKGRIESINGGLSFRYRELTAGSYLRVIDWLTLGAFYRLQFGATHNNDWIWPSTLEWYWQDTASRPEHVLIGDITFRLPLDFIPGSWRFELKAQYQHTFYYDSYSWYQRWFTLSVLRVRPGVSWFILREGSPFIDLTLQFDGYIPLNFDPKPFYAWYIYLGMLWHATEHIAFGPTVAFINKTWATSLEYTRASPGSTYEVYHRAVSIGLTVIFSLEP